ncbi:OprO/OprP family phosphate-selective porin [Parerythrobacter aestuarii]|uniref:OprO/OprP family phosphate-selective porin n=1 Tax=Parerythrobacter aestuarii TaxID=3020909 RepID=UPI0024DEE02D|nr:porin [Parerythrobacter aestuarii]
MHKYQHISALACAAALVFGQGSARADEGIDIGEDGIKLSLGDDTVEIDLGGKLMFDAYTFDDEVTDSTSGDFRRVRPDLRVKIADTVTMRAEWEFSGSKGWRNLYVQIEPTDGLTIRGGNFIVPFGMDDIQSSSRIPFAERSLVGAITPGFGLGGQIGYSGRRFTAKVGYFDDALDSEEGRSPERGKGVSGRITWLPMDKGKAKLHLGLGVESRSFDLSETVRYSATGGTTFAPRILRTARLDDLSSLKSLNAEIGFVSGPVAVQGQFVQQWIDRQTSANAKVSGGYVQASWMPTGESYRYSRGGGAISGPRIKNGIAVEIAGRLSWIDATDPALGGVKARAVDVSAGVYLTSFAKILLSGTKARKSDALGLSQDLTTAVLRFQLAF